MGESKEKKNQKLTSGGRQFIWHSSVIHKAFKRMSFSCNFQGINSVTVTTTVP